MAASENRKRKSRRGGADDRPLWGFLFRRETEGEDFMRSSFFSGTEEGEDEEPVASRGFLRELWARFNFWSLVATLLFLAFTGGLAVMVARMWTPQSLHDVAGYADQGNVRDLSVMLRHAAGGEITFTEAELNRYLRDTCRMRQTGIFSIFAHVQGVAVRVHDGYAELIIDRLVGSNTHQTTAVNLTFRQELDHGRPVLRVDFRGGSPLWGSTPRGGRIGQVGVPQRHMQMLRPALETLLDCYPGVREAVETYGYRPVFVRGRNGEESRVRLVPYASQSSSYHST